MRPVRPVSRLIVSIILCILISLPLFIFYAKYLPKLQAMVQGHGMESDTMWGNMFAIQRNSPCEKKMKIVYLKTHKCASSSLQNIFLRFGERHNLNFVLPNSGYQIGGGAVKFSQSMLGSDPKQNYNILCMHTRFNKIEMEAVMGKNTAYITMLRDPIDVFESQWQFYGLHGHFGMNIDQFAVAPKIGKLSTRWWKQIGQNQMLWDLGLDEVENEEMVLKKIDEIEKHFDLVMIAEQFDESLVLMKETLCWDFEDITSLKLNGRKDGWKKSLNESTKSYLKKYLNSDYMLYNHFKNIFQYKIKQFGTNKMNSELQNLAKTTADMTKSCSVTAEDNAALRGDSAWWGPGLVGYKVTGGVAEECRLMVMAELKFVDRIRKKQRGVRNDKTGEKEEPASK
eukprot:GFUD01131520.1.p1 GENE.GFUD01131520.1~~GFUD01131520.1.p1  ORF type:complete len:397 (+),score=109.33 GFUD01131520.1:40-1230(+)